MPSPFSDVAGARPRSLSAVAWRWAAVPVAWLCACSRIPTSAAEAVATPVATNANVSNATPPSKSPEPKPEPSIRLAGLERQIEELMPVAERWQLQMTPVLPCSWPPADRCVQFLFYNSAPLPTGTVQFRYRGPVSSVRCEFPSQECSLTRWEGKEDEFVRSEWSHADLPGQAAQEILLQVVRSGRVPDQVPRELMGYARWFGHHGGLGQSVRGRVPAFSAWLGTLNFHPG